MCQFAFCLTDVLQFTVIVRDYANYILLITILVMSGFENFSCRCYADFVTNSNVLTHYKGETTIPGTEGTGFESGQFRFQLGVRDNLGGWFPRMVSLISF